MIVGIAWSALVGAGASAEPDGPAQVAGVRSMLVYIAFNLAASSLRAVDGDAPACAERGTSRG